MRSSFVAAAPWRTAISAALVLALLGCSSGDATDTGLDPATLGRLQVDPDDPVCVAFRQVVETSTLPRTARPRADLTDALDARRSDWSRYLDALEASDNASDEVTELADISEGVGQTLLDAWGDDGSDLIERADEALLQPYQVAVSEAIDRGDDGPVREDVERLSAFRRDEADRCSYGDLDLPGLRTGDETAAAGFVLFRGEDGAGGGLRAVSTDGETTWAVDGLEGRDLGDMAVSPDGSQVLVTAFSTDDGDSALAVADVDGLRSGTDDPWAVIGEPSANWGQTVWADDPNEVVTVHGPYSARQLSVLDIASGQTTDVGPPTSRAETPYPGAVIDGTVVAHGASPGALQQVDIASEDATTILDMPHCTIADVRALSDDRLLTSIGCDDTRASGVYALDRDGSDLTPLITGVSSSTPRVSADGTWMAMSLVSEPGGDPHPWIARTDGTQARQLSDDWSGYATWIDD